MQTTSLRRRQFNAWVTTGVASAAALGVPLAYAQSAALTVIVPAPPGGTADFTARVLQEPLGRVLGGTVVVDNKGGGSGAVGAQVVLNARPDGNTCLLSFSGFHVMSPHLVKLPYDPLKDLQPVANLVSAPQVLVVRSSLPFTTAAELIAHAKANPGRLNYSSAGNGSVQHITAELFKNLTGTFITHIPYRGTGPMVTDLLASQVDMTMTTAPPLVQHVNSGRLRALLVTSGQRLSALPNVPTAEQAGVKNFEVASWFAMHTHGQAPKSSVDRLTAAVQQVVATPEFQRRMVDQGAVSTYMNPTDMRKYELAEFERWGRVIAAQKIKAD